MKILITGIHGFIGKNIVEYYNNSVHNIYGLDIINEPILGVEKIYQWDELNLIQDMDVIVHLAGKAHDVENNAQEDEYYKVNTGLTKKIFDFYLKSNSNHFYFISSVKAVADHIDHILKEEEIANPKTAYGKSKLEAEKYILNNLPEHPKKVYIYRPCMVYGKGNKGNLNLLYKFVSKGIPWPLGAFNNQRSFFSVSNFCFILNEFIDSNYPSGIYNLSDSETLSTNELIKLIAQVKDKKARIWKIPRPLIIFAAKLGTFFRLPLNNELLKKTTENYIVSNKKVITTIQKKLPLNTKDAIIETLKIL
jgi:nucleoside-diphosphate-sugar epimerase